MIVYFIFSDNFETYFPNKSWNFPAQSPSLLGVPIAIGRGEVAI